MLSVREKSLLLNIIKHCYRIVEKVNNITKEEFESNDDLQEIVCFNILQIGELAKNFTADFLQTYNQANWRQIKGMRDKVAHGYDTIDVKRVWETSKEDIKPLLDYCREILSSNEDNGEIA